MNLKLDIDTYRLNQSAFNKSSIKKLSTFDWMSDMPETKADTDYVEVQFKNTRKGYFLNSTKIPLEKGDMVAVESSPGHDIGEVTLTGRLVLLQMKKNNVKLEKIEIRRVYRKAKETDLEKYNEAKEKEQETMIKSRQIAEKMQLNMKIGDVEYQGDGNKAIFYYIADERVDFRQLIKVFAETFKVRIEMKQIGARQEAGRIGGIGSCGRELCCSSWITSFRSVSTSSARYQDISLNPQKLAGQCAKLKCCMNYELDVYTEALKDFPSKEIQLESKTALYYHFKTDVFKRLVSYSTDPNFGANLVTISVERAKEVIELNKKGEKPYTIEEKKQEKTSKEEPDIFDDTDKIDRFDTQKRKGRKQGENKNELNGNANKKPYRPKRRNFNNRKDNNNNQAESK